MSRQSVLGDQVSSTPSQVYERPIDGPKDLADVASWRSNVLAAKFGNERAVVVLGLIGDSDLSEGICSEFNGAADGAEPAPTLRSRLPPLLQQRYRSPGHRLFVSAADVDLSVAQTPGLRQFSPSLNGYHCGTLPGRRRVAIFGERPSTCRRDWPECVRLIPVGAADVRHVVCV